jgi:hypothetical protein
MSFTPAAVLRRSWLPIMSSGAELAGAKRMSAALDRAVGPRIYRFPAACAAFPERMPFELC